MAAMPPSYVDEFAPPIYVDDVQPKVMNGLKPVYLHDLCKAMSILGTTQIVYVNNDTHNAIRSCLGTSFHKVLFLHDHDTYQHEASDESLTKEKQQQKIMVDQSEESHVSGVDNNDYCDYADESEDYDDYDEDDFPYECQSRRGNTRSTTNKTTMIRMYYRGKKKAFDCKKLKKFSRRN